MSLLLAPHFNKVYNNAAHTRPQPPPPDELIDNWQDEAYETSKGAIMVKRPDGIRTLVEDGRCILSGKQIDTNPYDHASTRPTTSDPHISFPSYNLDMLFKHFTRPLPHHERRALQLMRGCKQDEPMSINTLQGFLMGVLLTMLEMAEIGERLNNGTTIRGVGARMAALGRRFLADAGGKLIMSWKVYEMVFIKHHET